MPAVAAMGSWMESLKMSMREIRRKYTKSEMAVMTWRAQEVEYTLRPGNGGFQQPQRAGEPPARLPNNYTAPHSQPLFTDEEVAVIESKLGSDLVDKLDEDLDMRKLTGPEAVRFLNAFGVSVVGRH